MPKLRNKKKTPRGRTSLCSLLPRTIKHHWITLQRPDMKRSMGKGPAGPFPASSALPGNNPVPWEKRAPGTQRGTGQGLSCTNMPRSRSQELCPHQHWAGNWQGPLLPLWDHRATGAHPSTSQRMLRDGQKKKGSDHFNPPQPAERERCRPEQHTGHVLPSRGLRQDFPFLTPALPSPGPIAASPPRAKGRCQSVSSPGSGVASPSPGVAMAGAMPKAVFSRRDEGVCLAGNGETADGRAQGERGFSSRRCPHSHFRR